MMSRGLAREQKQGLMRRHRGEEGSRGDSKRRKKEKGEDARKRGGAGGGEEEEQKEEKEGGGNRSPIVKADGSKRRWGKKRPDSAPQAPRLERSTNRGCRSHAP